MGGWAQTSANPTMKMDSCIPFCMIFFTIFFRHVRFERNRNFYARNWKLFDDWNLYHTLLQILTPKEGRQTLLILHQLIFLYSKFVKFSIFALLFFTYKCGTTLIGVRSLDFNQEDISMLFLDRDCFRYFYGICSYLKEFRILDKYKDK